MVEHQHLIVRAECNVPTDKKTIEKWIVELVEKIEMSLVVGPFSAYIDQVGNRGLSCVVIIETSHISVHTWDDTSPNIFQLDVYSCKAFDLDKVFAHMQVFNPTKIEYKFLDRKNGLEIVI